MKLQQLMEKIENLAPKTLAENWDNVGLLVGDKDQEVANAVVCLDITEEAYRMCVEKQARVCISHHPFLFEPTRRIDFTDPYYKLLRLFIQADIAIYAAHTNLDACVGGVNDALCALLDIAPFATFIPSGDPFDFQMRVVPGIGRIGKQRKETGLYDFYRNVQENLKTSGCHINFDRDRPIQKILVVGGSYDSEWNADVLDNGIDVVVCGEMKHRDMVYFERVGVAVIAAGHDATERVVLPVLADYLNGAEGFQTYVCPSRHNKPVLRI